MVASELDIALPVNVVKRTAIIARRGLCPFLAICILLLLSVGCGKNEFELVPVEGTITLDNGPWPMPGVVYFTVETPAAGRPNRPAMGKFDTDGKLTVTTFRSGDGLMPGKYKMGVECWEIAPQIGSATPARSFVAQRYQSPATSGLTVVIEPGQRIGRLKLDVTRK